MNEGLTGLERCDSVKINDYFGVNYPLIMYFNNADFMIWYFFLISLFLLQVNGTL